jgi:hypothetical protein
MTRLQGRLTCTAACHGMPLCLAGGTPWTVTYTCPSSTDPSQLTLSGSVTEPTTTCSKISSATVPLNGTADPYLLVEDGDPVPYCSGSTSVIVNFNVTSSVPPVNWAPTLVAPQVVEPVGSGVTCEAVESTAEKPNPQPLSTDGFNSKLQCCLCDGSISAFWACWLAVPVVIVCCHRHIPQMSPIGLVNVCSCICISPLCLGPCSLRPCQAVPKPCHADTAIQPHSSS